MASHEEDQDNGEHCNNGVRRNRNSKPGGVCSLDTVDILDLNDESLDDEYSWLHESRKHRSARNISPYKWLREEFEDPAVRNQKMSDTLRWASLSLSGRRKSHPPTFYAKSAYNDESQISAYTDLEGLSILGDTPLSSQAATVTVVAPTAATDLAAAAGSDDEPVDISRASSSPSNGCKTSRAERAASSGLARSVPIDENQSTDLLQTPNTHNDSSQDTFSSVSLSVDAHINVPSKCKATSGVDSIQRMSVSFTENSRATSDGVKGRGKAVTRSHSDVMKRPISLKQPRELVRAEPSAAHVTDDKNGVEITIGRTNMISNDPSELQLNSEHSHSAGVAAQLAASSKSFAMIRGHPIRRSRRGERCTDISLVDRNINRPIRIRSESYTLLSNVNSGHQLVDIPFDRENCENDGLESCRPEQQQQVDLDNSVDLVELLSVEGNNESNIGRLAMKNKKTNCDINIIIPHSKGMQEKQNICSVKDDTNMCKALHGSEVGLVREFRNSCILDSKQWSSNGAVRSVGLEQLAMNYVALDTQDAAEREMICAESGNDQSTLSAPPTITSSGKQRPVNLPHPQCSVTSSGKQSPVNLPHPQCSVTSSGKQSPVILSYPQCSVSSSEKQSPVNLPHPQCSVTSSEKQNPVNLPHPQCSVTAGLVLDDVDVSRMLMTTAASCEDDAARSRDESVSSLTVESNRRLDSGVQKCSSSRYQEFIDIRESNSIQREAQVQISNGILNNRTASTAAFYAEKNTKSTSYRPTIELEKNGCTLRNEGSLKVDSLSNEPSTVSINQSLSGSVDKENECGVSQLVQPSLRRSLMRAPSAGRSQYSEVRQREESVSPVKLFKPVLGEVPLTTREELKSVLGEVPLTSREELKPVLGEVPLTSREELKSVLGEVPLTSREELKPVLGEVPLTSREEFKPVLGEVPLTSREELKPVLGEAPRGAKVVLRPPSTNISVRSPREKSSIPPPSSQSQTPRSVSDVRQPRPVDTFRQKCEATAARVQRSKSTIACLPRSQYCTGPSSVSSPGGRAAARVESRQSEKQCIGYQSNGSLLQQTRGRASDVACAFTPVNTDVNAHGSRSNKSVNRSASCSAASRSIRSSTAITRIAQPSKQTRPVNSQPAVRRSNTTAANIDVRPPAAIAAPITSVTSHKSLGTPSVLRRPTSVVRSRIDSGINASPIQYPVKPAMRDKSVPNRPKMSLSAYEGSRAGRVDERVVTPDRGGLTAATERDPAVDRRSCIPGPVRKQLPRVPRASSTISRRQSSMM